MKHWLMGLLVFAWMPLSHGCMVLGPAIRAIEYPEIEHQKQLRDKLPKPKPLIDPYRNPELHIKPGPAITPDKFDAADPPGLRLMSTTD